MKLVISETASSTWNYHLRLVKPGQEKFGGGAGLALCGRELGWDTRLPLKSYGMKDHIPSAYCQACLDKAKSEKLNGSEEIK